MIHPINSERASHRWIRLFVSSLACILASSALSAQSYPAGRDERPGPMLDAGFVSYDTPQLHLKLVRSSGTVAALEPKTETTKPGEEPFDFTPGELIAARSVDGYYHLGDLDLRLRTQGETDWRGYSTALARHPVKEIPVSGSILAKADLSPTLPSDFPLAIVRTWSAEGGRLALHFELRNTTSKPIEIGALGIPLIFDNIISGKSLDQAHTICSFSDPSIAEDAGYVQVTRLNGSGPALVVVPDGNTPLEAYAPIAQERGRNKPPVLFEDRTPRSMTFEGFYEWMVASAADQQTEWKQAQPWNPATSIVLKPGQSRTIGLRFLVSDSIRDIEKTLAANTRPVAVGIPGYILPEDQDGSLFLKYTKAVQSIAVDPAGAIDIAPGSSSPTGWQRYLLHGKQWGRARLTITYTGGLTETVNYLVIKPQSQAVADLGHFLFHEQWFADKNDPFHRAPSIISYDHEAHQQVTQDSRVWIAGLSDEAGAGSWLAAAMKEYGAPDKDEVAKLEDFVDGVLWGGIQFKDGPHKFGVRKSLFYYQPDQLPAGYYRKDLDWTTWESWSREASEDVGRSFNYPHVVAAYWSLYRLARFHQGLATHHDWRWYLTQSYETTMAMTRDAEYYSQFGQMEGDIFVALLDDLRREGMTAEADTLEAAMRKRADAWRKEAYPFGSEMPWDSTGQEEVYAWTRHFGFDDKAQVTLDAILGYMPTIPSWGYNGSARRYWDFLYGGKYPRLERQLHHYGSGINAIPVLDAYRRNPSDLYLLRVGYGGDMGAISGIHEDGFASAAFHSYPDRMAFDPYSGDYGPNFFGHAWTTASYLVDDPELGWLAFGGNLTESSDAITLTPRDSFRQRVYIAPVGLWLRLDSGQFSTVTYHPSSHEVTIELAAKDAFTRTASLRIEQPAQLPGIGRIVPAQQFASERGAFTIPLGASPSTIHLQVKTP